MQTFRFGLIEITVRLDFPLDVLKLCLELFLRLDTLHEHDLVVLVHLIELLVHVLQRHIIILLWQILLHILLNEATLGF